MKIKKIEKINDMGVFSSFIWDENVFGTNREPVEFNRINVIYGRNYSGKNTLSRLFRFALLNFPVDKKSQFQVKELGLFY